MGIENLGFGGISTLLQSATADLSKLEKLFEGAVGGQKSGHGCCGKGDQGDKGGLSGLLGEIKEELSQL